MDRVILLTAGGRNVILFKHIQLIGIRTGGRPLIYLDYSANTPADPAVLEAFLNTEQNYIGNPNSNHPAGQAAREKRPVLLADQS